MGLKLLTRIRLGLSYLNEYRFNHNFESCLNPCNLEVKSTTHFFLHCHHFNAVHITLNNSLKVIDKDISKLSDSSLTNVILFGDSKYSDIQNHDILNSTHGIIGVHKSPLNLCPPLIPKLQVSP